MSKVKSIRLFKNLALTLTALFFASCGSTEKTSSVNKNMPDWVTGPSAKYPSSAYLTGRGSAQDKRSAEIDAVNELCTIFGQKVTSATKSTKRMEMAQSKGLISSSDSASLDHEVLRQVNQDDIIAVEIPEYFESKKEGLWYALAVMPKEKATQIYSTMADKNLKEVNSILSELKASSSPNTMQNYSRLDFAEEVAGITQKYIQRITVLNPAAGEKYSSAVTPVQIHKIKMEMAEKIPVCVNVSDDLDGRVAKSFQEVMSDFGFNTTIGSNERYVINCNLHLNESTSSNEKTKFCEYAAECSFNDTFIGETLVPLEVTGREGSPTYQNAEIRAKQKIVTKVKSDFKARFQDYLGNFSDF